LNGYQVGLSGILLPGINCLQGNWRNAYEPKKFSVDSTNVVTCNHDKVSFTHSKTSKELLFMLWPLPEEVLFLLE
jgi:hypothetical protein